jgi:histidinol-phosphate aminotransferase
MLSRLGFAVLPSAANFVFARHPGRTGTALAAALRAQGVLVRHFDKPRIADHLRISVGTGSDTNRLIAALTRHLESNSADQSVGPT